MTYGAFASYRDVRKAVEDKTCEVAVNHFRSVQLVRAVTTAKVQARIAYAQKFVVPAAACIILALSAYPSPFAWVAVLVNLGISYFFDVQQTFVLLGLVAAAVGLTINNNLLILVGFPLLVAFICALVWWANITRIVSREVLASKPQFDSMWQEGLIVLVTEDHVHSVSGITKRKQSLKDIRDFKEQQSGKE